MASETTLTATPRGPRPTKHVDVLWAAARLFARQGVAQTSTRQVAAEAGTTERTLFKHFGSKDGLVQAVIAEAVMPHLAPSSLQALRAAIEQAGSDFAAWHRALLHARDAAMAQAPELTRLLLVELLRDEALRARFTTLWLDAAWTPLVKQFVQLQRRDHLRKDIAAATLVRLFLSLNLGYLVSRHVLAQDLDWQPDAEIDAVARLFSEGAGAAPGAQSSVAGVRSGQA